jgi:hypothetical protein
MPCARKKIFDGVPKNEILIDAEAFNVIVGREPNEPAIVPLAYGIWLEPEMRTFWFENEALLDLVAQKVVEGSIPDFVTSYKCVVANEAVWTHLLCCILPRKFEAINV